MVSYERERENEYGHVKSHMHNGFTTKRYWHLHNLTWMLISYFILFFSILINHSELSSCINYVCMCNKLPQNLAAKKNKYLFNSISANRNLGMT